ncbi:nitric oxide reductase FlRd-NAD(+) reductase [Ferrimonas sediminum]|uniref:Nitric oxide reductase FlRd-NAD(+) reductase n=1 Tax=Ferrimonas sediminum TaxID=718193 RepID=A0A1G8X565_9GAMM|nr:NADH:flavorubredoxin reductase NorW [Ferrimonas sediminum]SDJ85758.1 nitric oxide reductase FlRd-NAD(+) reductase [Ferrimonas sediminum]
MSAPLVIVGSGFAAYQLVKALRRLDSEHPITLITQGSGDEYSKPEISHVFSKGQPANQLIQRRGEVFAEEMNLTLMAHTRVKAIDIANQRLDTSGGSVDYQQLVLATGASAMVPVIDGDAGGDLITLNSLDAYHKVEQRLSQARSVMVIGAGLIGTEMAMDLASAGRQVVLCDRAERVLPQLLPPFISAQLAGVLQQQGVNLALSDSLRRLSRDGDTLVATMTSGQQHRVDEAICATGLMPNTALAAAAGLMVNKGIVVDNQLRSSDPQVFALGDCAEVEGKHEPFLQPILLAANALAQTLSGTATARHGAPMMVKVKTPLMPMQLAGDTHSASRWQVEITDGGLTAQALNDSDQLQGFVVSGDHQPQGFALLRQLNS